MDSRRGMYLGVDGGGTKTAVVVAEYQPEQGLVVRSRVEGHSSNLQAVGWDRAIEGLGKWVQEACAQAGGSPEELDGACFCLAGLSGPRQRQTLRAWLADSGVACPCHIATDAHLLLAAAHPSDGAPVRPLEGIGLIAGTGSIALGMRGGKTYRAGGWGYLLGDEGSAFWLGRHLLELACRIADGRGGPEAVLQAVQQFAAVERPHELTGWVYGAADPRLRIASVGPLVFALNDIPEVQPMVEAGATALADLVRCVARRSGYSGDDYPLVVSGGVLVHQPVYVQRVQAALADMDCAPGNVTRVVDPVLGAVRLAVWQGDAAV